MNVQQPFLIPWMGLSNQQAAAQVAVAQQQLHSGAQQPQQQQQQQQIHPHQLQHLQNLQKLQQQQQQQTPQHAAQHAAQAAAANSLQLAQISALQQQYNSALQHAAAVAAAAAGHGQAVTGLPAALAAALSAQHAQQQHAAAQQAQGQQPFYQNMTSVTQSPAMMTLHGMHGLLQAAPAVSTVSQMSLHNNPQFLAAAAAAASSPQYTSVQKILIPGSKVRRPFDFVSARWAFFGLGATLKCH